MRPSAAVCGVGAVALAPHLEPRGVYFFLALLDGRGGRARVPEVRACAPHPPSRARSDHTHTCRRSRTLATPSASLARPLRPSLDHDTMPRAAQRTARVARPFIGPPSSLAARPAATLLSSNRRETAMSRCPTRRLRRCPRRSRCCCKAGQGRAGMVCEHHPSPRPRVRRRLRLDACQGHVLRNRSCQILVCLGSSSLLLRFWHWLLTLVHGFGLNCFLRLLSLAALW